MPLPPADDVIAPANLHVEVRKGDVIPYDVVVVLQEFAERIPQPELKGELRSRARKATWDGALQAITNQLSGTPTPASTLRGNRHDARRYLTAAATGKLRPASDLDRVQACVHADRKQKAATSDGDRVSRHRGGVCSCRSGVAALPGPGKPTGPVVALDQLIGAEHEQTRLLPPTFCRVASERVAEHLLPVLNTPGVLKPELLVEASGAVGPRDAACLERRCVCDRAEKNASSSTAARPTPWR